MPVNLYFFNFLYLKVHSRLNFEDKFLITHLKYHEYVPKNSNSCIRTKFDIHAYKQKRKLPNQNRIYCHVNVDIGEKIRFVDVKDLQSKNSKVFIAPIYQEFVSKKPNEEFWLAADNYLEFLGNVKYAIFVIDNIEYKVPLKKRKEKNVISSEHCFYKDYSMEIPDSLVQLMECRDESKWPFDPEFIQSIIDKDEEVAAENILKNNEREQIPDDFEFYPLCDDDEDEIQRKKQKKSENDIINTKEQDDDFMDLV